MARKPMAGRRAILVRMSGKPIDGKVSRFDKNNIVIVQWLIDRCKDRVKKNYGKSMVHYESKIEGRTLCGRLIGAKIAKRVKSGNLCGGWKLPGFKICRKCQLLKASNSLK